MMDRAQAAVPEGGKKCFLQQSKYLQNVVWLSWTNGHAPDRRHQVQATAT